MNIIIMHQTVTNHDAIGNDIEAMYTLLNKEHNCFVYAENRLNNVVEYIDENRLQQMIEETDSVVIYHHSIYWPKGHQILKNAKGKIIFRYHNITPARFFEKYNTTYAESCTKGRTQTEELVREFQSAFWIADSYYNTEDLVGVEQERMAVCPPFHKLQKWITGRPDEQILKKLIEDTTINLLFVGRVVPNKGHFFLLDILRAFRSNYSEKIKLRIIGKFDTGLEGYNRLLKNYIKEYKLSDCVEFVGEINDAILLSYYLGSDMLVCASEHEGFCVPIVEAQYTGLPILARKECAVPETMGQEQLLFDDSPDMFAAAIHTLVDNKNYMKYLTQKGFENVHKRFDEDIIRQCFMDAFAKGAGI